jgi:hypothetical protein
MKTGGIGGGIARVAQLRADRFNMATVNRTINSGDDEDRGDSGAARTARNVQIEKRTQMRERACESARIEMGGKDIL